MSTCLNILWSFLPGPANTICPKSESDLKLMWIIDLICSDFTNSQAIFAHRKQNQKKKIHLCIWCPQRPMPSLISNFVSSFIESTKGQIDLIEAIFDTRMNFLAFEYFPLRSQMKRNPYRYRIGRPLTLCRIQYKRSNSNVQCSCVSRVCQQSTYLIIHRMRHFLKIIQSTCRT